MRFAIFYDSAPGTVGEYFLKAFKALGHAVDYFPTSRAEQCPGNYDIHLRIDHGDYTYDLPDRLRPKAFYIVDSHLTKSWRSIQRQAPRYDHLFCVQRQAARLLPSASWVPLACDPDVHYAPSAGPGYDLAFVGNDGGVPRKLYLQELRERYPKSFIGKAPPADMAAIYGRAKIGFHYIECTSPMKDMLSMRVYEVLVSGSMLLANALPDGAFEAAGLRDRTELVLYRTSRELFELVDYYLAHHDERRRIGEAGRACALARHTYRHRAEQIVELLNGKPG